MHKKAKKKYWAREMGNVSAGAAKRKTTSTFFFKAKPWPLGSPQLVGMWLAKEEVGCHGNNSY